MQGSHNECCIWSWAFSFLFSCHSEQSEESALNETSLNVVEG